MQVNIIRGENEILQQISMKYTRSFVDILKNIFK
jgi:hypothetical protein